MALSQSQLVIMSKFPLATLNNQMTWKPNMLREAWEPAWTLCWQEAVSKKHGSVDAKHGLIVASLCCFVGFSFFPSFSSDTFVFNPLTLDRRIQKDREERKEFSE